MSHQQSTMTDPLVLAEAITSCKRTTTNLHLHVTSAHALASEIERLQGIISRAKIESELIEHKGKTMIAVPYWFIKV